MATKTIHHNGVTVVIHNVERLTPERMAEAFRPLVLAKARQQAEEPANEAVTA